MCQRLQITVLQAAIAIREGAAVAMTGELGLHFQLQVVQLHTQRGLDVVVVDLAVGQEKTLDSEIKYVSQTVGGWTTGKVSSAVTSYLEVHYGMVEDDLVKIDLPDKFVNDIGGNVAATRVQHPSGQTLQQSEDTFTRAYKGFENDIPAARRALEIEFRKILGVEQDKAQQGVE